MLELYDYQLKGKSDIYGQWNAGKKNTLFVCPTGGGKSVVISDIVLDGARENMQQVVIAHRNELVAQMSGHIANRGIPHRIVGSKETVRQIVSQHREKFNRSFVNPSARTAVVGVDTLIARADNLTPWFLQTQRWVGDEAHHFLRANKWGKAVRMMPHALGLGVTATPCRADGQGLGGEYDGVFDSMVLGPSMRELIDAGRLSDYEIVCPTSDIVEHIDFNKVGKDGDLTSQVLKSAAEKSRIVGDVVENYICYANGRKAICFATDIETGCKIAAKFNDAGVRSACLSSKTPTTTRDKHLKEFRAGKLLVLVNVDLFDEGFDVPDCEVVIMARPTASLCKYMQQIGRALRYMPDKIALIIDHVSNVKRHKLPDMPRVWSLMRRDKRAKKMPDPEDIPLTTCKECSRPYERFHAICPYCGAVPPLPEPSNRTIEMVDGDLMLLDKSALQKLRDGMRLESPSDMAERVAAAAGDVPARGAYNKQFAKIQAQAALSHVIAQWAAIGRQKGRSDKELYRRFYMATGVDVLSALSAERSRQDYEQLTETVRNWYES